MKRILALLAAMAMLLSLAACGESQSPDNTSGSDVSSSATADADTPSNDAAEPGTTQDGADQPAETTDGAQPDGDTTAAPTDGTRAPRPTGPESTSIKTEPDPEVIIPVITTKPGVKPTAPQPEGEDIVLPDDNGSEPEKPPEIDADVEINTPHTPIKEADYYQLSQLSGDEAKLYHRIAEAVPKTQSKVDTSDLNITTEQVGKIFHCYSADYPQSFWLTRRYLRISDPTTKKLKTLLLIYSDGTTQDTYDNTGKLVQEADRQVIKQKIQTLSAKIKSIVDAVPTNVTVLDKEKIIHDYILSHVIYDTATANSAHPSDKPLPHAFDIYGSAIEGKSVCEGYSKLFQYLCYCVGIQSNVVIGTGKGTGHMWNTVQMDGKWYHIDVTWDDGARHPYYAYFNVTEKEIVAMDHSVERGELAVPSCTSTDAAFYNLYCLDARDLSKEPKNLQKVADRLSKNDDEYLIIYFTKGKKPDNEYLKKYIMFNGSTLGQYIAEKGYTYTIGNSMSSYPQYMYIPVERK